MSNDKIDFIITWVDGNDPKWQKERNSVLKTNDTIDPERYRDWDNLKYIFRGIEKNAPWVNKVYFVTWGHLPKWLNTKNDKLVVINHKDYIPNKYLPTYSSHVLELNFHRIKELSNNFVYFNDDTFIIDKLKETDFFINNKPLDYAILTSICTEEDYLFPHVLMNNMYVINHNFSFMENFKHNITNWFNIKYGIGQFRTLLLLPWKSFTGLKYSHIPSAFNKKTFFEVWDKEYNILDNTCSHKVRDYSDVNQYVIKAWQIAKSEFVPMNPKIGRLYSITDDTTKICDAISTKKYKLLCINDSKNISNFEKTKEGINKALDAIYPEKSSFEK